MAWPPFLIPLHLSQWSNFATNARVARKEAISTCVHRTLEPTRTRAKREWVGGCAAPFAVRDGSREGQIDPSSRTGEGERPPGIITSPHRSGWVLEWYWAPSDIRRGAAPRAHNDAKGILYCMPVGFIASRSTPSRVWYVALHCPRLSKFDTFYSRWQSRPYLESPSDALQHFAGLRRSEARAQAQSYVFERAERAARDHILFSVPPSCPSICSLGSKNPLFLIHPPATQER
jgi:hypothetical protein